MSLIVFIMASEVTHLSITKAAGSVMRVQIAVLLQEGHVPVKKKMNPGLTKKEEKA